MKIRPRLSICTASSILLLSLVSCERLLLPTTPAHDNATVFDSMWKTIHERYTFFTFKRIDWNAVRAKYRERAISARNEQELFAVLAATLNELQDDHTNLVSTFDVSRAEPFYNDSTNYDQDILERVYLRRKQWFTGALTHAILERRGKKYGYINYGSFSNDIDTAAWNTVIRRFRQENVAGMIFDIRSNGGGSIGNVIFLASRLAQAPSDVLLEMTKNGPGPNDYNPPKKLTIRPDTAADEQMYRFIDRPVAVLTNRRSYSAASFFPACLKAPEFKHVRLIGDHTGGGSGLPIDAQLPNGWTYRFSGTKTFIPAGRITKAQAQAVAPQANHDADWSIGYNFEWGVPIDIRVNMNLADRSRDAILERAMDYIDTGR
ncbi:MAG: S41 family peptidase [Bacteroidota bacterium]|nr:S41 family peptidase [Candidatus Kapabacteria bacterium]MDW8220045.1 S41 family peptidase [Bacteroidota bacterium]